MKARKAARDKARELRRRGMTLREIAADIGASLSSVSVWTRDLAPPGILLQREGAEPLTGRRLPVTALTRLRQCGRCGLTLPLCVFGRGQYRCVRCCREYLRDRGDLHRAQSGAALVARRIRAKRHLLAYLLNHPCSDCGESDPVVLEFDHLAHKRMGLADLAHLGATPARLDEEIALCEVVCACCHRRRTSERRGASRGGRPNRERNARYVSEVLRRSACRDCGESDPAVLEFDHVGPKSANVSQLVNREAALERVRREIEQCIVRCANCHRRRTSEGGQHFRSRHA